MWTVSEEAILDLSLNGADYLGGFAFTFYDKIDLYRVVPMAGPTEGHTRVKLFGTGFNAGWNREDIHVKWGVLETQTIEKEQVVDYIWQNENEFVQNTMVAGSEILAAYKKETYNV